MLGQEGADGGSLLSRRDRVVVFPAGPTIGPEAVEPLPPGRTTHARLAHWSRNGPRSEIGRPSATEPGPVASRPGRAHVIPSQLRRSSEIRRAIAQRYPFLPFRNRLTFFQWTLDDLPEDVVVDTRFDIRVRVKRDFQYLGVYCWGDYEPYATKIYRRIIRPGQTVIDVGTNFGWFAALFARWVGRAGHVHAFEPVPFIHDLAAETLELNDVTSRVRLNRMALGRAPGTTTIRTYAGLSYGHATAVDLGRSDAVEHTCRVATLDDYCSEYRIETVDFVKVDVEGYEPDVFVGGRRTLSSLHAPIVAFELNNMWLRERSLAANDVVDELRSSGYSHFFQFSTRRGIRAFDSPDFVHGDVIGDCIAAKHGHLPFLERALKTGRVIR
jgi:FkbM family methyltransferase